MNRILVILFIFTLCFLQLSCVDDEGWQMSAEEIKVVFDYYGVPAYPDLAKLADQRIYTPKIRGSEIAWEGFYSSDSYPKIVAYYQEKLDNKLMETRAETTIWRLPADEPKIVLTVMSVSAPGPHHQYLNLIPKEAKSIVLLSRLLTRKDEK